MRRVDLRSSRPPGDRAPGIGCKIAFVFRGQRVLLQRRHLNHHNLERSRTSEATKVDGVFLRWREPTENACRSVDFGTFSLNFLLMFRVINSALPAQPSRPEQIHTTACPRHCFAFYRLDSQEEPVPSLTKSPPSTASSPHPSPMPPEPSSPDWAMLSDDLRALVLSTGPLPLERLSGAYKAMHGKPFKLHGHKLQQSLDSGKLQGVRYDASNLTLALEDTTTAGKTTAPPAGKVPSSPDWARLSKGLRSLVATKGPLLLEIVGEVYKSVFGQPLDSHLRGHDLKMSLESGNLRGVRYNASNGKMEVDDTPVMPAKGSGPPAKPKTAKPLHGTKANPVKHLAVEELGRTTGPAPEEGQRRRPISKGGSAAIPPTTSDEISSCSSTSDPESLYLLIDSPNSWRESLATLRSGGARGSTLQHICSKGMVVMQLNGDQLGSAAGEISLIKVRESIFCVPVDE